MLNSHFAWHGEKWIDGGSVIEVSDLSLTDAQLLHAGGAPARIICWRRLTVVGDCSMSGVSIGSPGLLLEVKPSASLVVTDDFTISRGTQVNLAAYAVSGGGTILVEPGAGFELPGYKFEIHSTMILRVGEVT